MLYILVLRDVPINYSKTGFLIPSNVISELNQILSISFSEPHADCSMFNDEGKVDNYSDNYTSTL